LSGIPSTSKLHILFEREDLHYNYLVCQQMLPSINELKIVYQTLAKHTTGSFICSLNINEFRDILIEQSKIDIHHSGLINIFRIFQELDIIKFNIKNGFINISDYKKHDSKLRLEFSDTYMHLYLLKKDVIKFYNQFNTLTAKLFKGYGGN
jgi:single-stranded-DNA-specific exonuclease